MNLAVSDKNRSPCLYRCRNLSAVPQTITRLADQSGNVCRIEITLACNSADIMMALRQKTVEHLHGTRLIASYRWIPRPVIARQLGYAFHSVSFQRALPARPRVVLLLPPPVIAVVPPAPPPPQPAGAPGESRSPRGAAGPGCGSVGVHLPAAARHCRRRASPYGLGSQRWRTRSPPKHSPGGARGAPPGAPPGRPSRSAQHREVAPILADSPGKHLRHRGG